jgi:general secretion pathway protein J
MKGFTLVEMLVALSALAVLAAGGFAVAGAAAASHEAIAQRQHETDELMRLRAALRGDLMQAATRRARDINGAKPQAALQASGGSEGVFLSLVRRGWTNPAGRDRASLQAVDYRLRQGRVERIWRRHVDGSPAQEPQLLMDGVQSVAISFYEFGQWTGAWTGAPNRPLPEAIRLTLSTDEGDVTQIFLLPEARL